MVSEVVSGLRMVGQVALELRQPEWKLSRLINRLVQAGRISVPKIGRYRLLDQAAIEVLKAELSQMEVMTT